MFFFMGFLSESKNGKQISTFFRLEDMIIFSCATIIKTIKDKENGGNFNESYNFCCD